MGQRGSILIQKATADDYENVMAIRSAEEMYDGTDYLPTSYYDNIGAPENTGYCAILNQEIVAFALVSLVNDKRTIVLKAVRVKKNLSGRGIVRELIKWIATHYMKRGAENCYVSFIQNHLFEKMQQGHLRMVTIRKELYFRAKEMSKITPSMLHHEQLQHLNADQLANIFSDEDKREHLFPTDCFVSFWTPFDPIPSNVPFIMKKEKLMLGSRIAFTDTMIISCGTLNKTDHISMYFLDLYGNLKMTTDLRSHLILHIENCKREINGDIKFAVFIDERSNEKEIYKLFREINMKHEIDRMLVVGEKRLRDMI